MNMFGTIAAGLFASVVLNFGVAQAKDHGQHETTKPSEVAPLSEESIYNLKSELLDQNGKKVTLAALRGQPVVIAMAYTSCAYACPLILSHMQQLEKELDSQGKKNVRFVLVSFDPEKDTPEVMKKYAEKRKLSSHWAVFTASSDKAPREIANLLGVKYKKIDDADFDHSFVITVLNSEGIIQGQQVGADKNPKDLSKYIQN